MAELGDVEEALVNSIIEAAYPGGINSLSSVGMPLRIYRGKPTNATLALDRSTGTVDVSVWPLEDSTTNTTRWGMQVSEVANPSSLSVGISGNSATFFGTAASGDLAGVLINQQAFVYQTESGDSASLVAAALADAIRASMICWLSGATITVPDAFEFTARTASAVSTLEEWCRQAQQFQISIRAPTPLARDAVAKVIGAALAQISFLTLADGTGGRLRYKSTANHDGDQAVLIYQRDLNYEVEYGTTTVSISPAMLFGDLVWNGTTIYA